MQTEGGKAGGSAYDEMLGQEPVFRLRLLVTWWALTALSDELNLRPSPGNKGLKVCDE